MTAMPGGLFGLLAIGCPLHGSVAVNPPVWSDAVGSGAVDPTTVAVWIVSAAAETDPLFGFGVSPIFVVVVALVAWPG
jgi:hypothetical protein